MVRAEPVGVGVSVGAAVHRALEWLLPGVQPLVSLQLAGLYKGAGAVWVVAEVRSLAGVSPEVSLE